MSESKSGISRHRMTREMMGEFSAKATGIANGMMEAIPRSENGTIDVMAALVALESVRADIRARVDEAMEGMPGEKELFEQQLKTYLDSTRAFRVNSNAPGGSA